VTDLVGKGATRPRFHWQSASHIPIAGCDESGSRSTQRGQRLQRGSDGGDKVYHDQSGTVVRALSSTFR
jgi:hypothetical protein